MCQPWIVSDIIGLPASCNTMIEFLNPSCQFLFSGFFFGMEFNLYQSLLNCLRMNQTHEDLHYKKKIGAYRPNFQTKPDTYYILSILDICCGLFACCGVIFAALGVCIGLFYWSHNINTDSLVLAWSIILVVFVFFFMITAFCFSKGKAEVEEKLIQRALQKQMHLKDQKSKEGRDRKDLKNDQTYVTQEYLVER